MPTRLERWIRSTALAITALLRPSSPVPWRPSRGDEPDPVFLAAESR